MGFIAAVLMSRSSSITGGGVEVVDSEERGRGFGIGVVSRRLLAVSDYTSNFKQET